MHGVTEAGLSGVFLITVGSALKSSLVMLWP